MRVLAVSSAKSDGNHAQLPGPEEILEGVVSDVYRPRCFDVELLQRRLEREDARLPRCPAPLVGKHDGIEGVSQPQRRKLALLHRQVTVADQAEAIMAANLLRARSPTSSPKQSFTCLKKSMSIIRSDNGRM